ncbi:MAG: hypothetical protein FJ118_06200 [Deltaproteobacteria bacterium]|nr:hypothetical protein [Deltaproteobacteria bacterium]
MTKPKKAKPKAAERKAEDRVEIRDTPGAPVEQIGEEEEAVIATAKDIPPPSSRLGAPPKGPLGSLKIALLKDAPAGLSLEEIKKMTGPGATRPPVMSIIEAVLADAGGAMELKKLCVEVEKYWNRPFPSTPYTKEEFLYILVSKSHYVTFGS